MLKTPFRPYAVGKADKPHSMAKNEERFVFTPLEEFKTLLQKCCDRFPVSGNVALRTKSPERAGQTWALRIRSTLISSTGPISEIGGMELSKDDKMLVPSMGVSWWKDMFTPSVLKCLDFGAGSPSVHANAKLRQHSRKTCQQHGVKTPRKE